MTVVVQKFGGSSVADVPKLQRVAQRVAATRAAGEDVVVVVSAMGKTTDELLGLAHQIDADPPRRELDMLLTTGERVSMALLSMAIQKLGQDAISFTGSQSGIITNDRHFDARIIEVRPFRIEDELARGKVVIVAGYQGMSYRREITTLGRGGSDTTAVALAAALGAERAEIYSDVDGVYSADPRVVPDAQHLPELSYEQMQEMSEAGAKVLNSTAVEFARRARIAIHARSTFAEGRESIVRDGAAGGGVAVVGRKDLFRVHLAGGAAALGRGLDLAEELGASVRASSVEGDDARLLLSCPGDASARYEALGARVERGLGAVSLISGALGERPSALRAALDVLTRAGLSPDSVQTAPLRWSALLPAEQVDDAVRALHAAWPGGTS
ncbi:MAG: aspartate kinase [Sandaracinaceae bacterium]|nr:MAG: aspartate kinase [Sandaracinaceae bacterium]